jgi:undecaprenyl-diphosphatase
MTSSIYAIILGMVEGVTEFLPVSSTGHLIVLTELLQFRETGGTFEIGIQLGAVMAVLWFYRETLVVQAQTVFSDARTQRFWLGIILAFIPAGGIGFLLANYITTYLFSPLVVAAALIAGGIGLWVMEAIPRKSQTSELHSITLRQAIMVGIAQIAALIPGVSRSASTIVGGMLCGLDRPTATAFSFYLSIPTLGLATAYVILRDINTFDRSTLIDIAIGLTVSFMTALLAIRWLLRYVSKHDFRLFAIYRIVAGIGILIFFGFL